MDHAWCRDIARDAAVRAAEDGRTGPLPTLGECMEAPFTQAAERSVPVSETGERQSGMRTERVTLEIVHDGENGDPADWPFDAVLGGEGWIGDGESVRVVEEAHFDDLAQVAMERDAAIRERDALRASAITQSLTADRFAAAVAEADMLRSRVAELEAKLAPHANAVCGSNHAAQAASGGGEGEPVVDAWGVVQNGTVESVIHRRFRQDAEDIAERWDCPVVPLYRAPPQPRGWLTEEERDIIAGIANDDEYTEEGQNIAKALLARSSPPDVVLPVPDCSWCSDYATVWRDCLDAVRSSLAAAGVAVKEVGK